MTITGNADNEYENEDKDDEKEQEGEGERGGEGEGENFIQLIVIKLPIKVNPKILKLKQTWTCCKGETIVSCELHLVFFQRHFYFTDSMHH